MTVKDARAHHEPDHHEEGPGYQPHDMVLLGCGHANLHVLSSLAARPLIGVQVVLVAPHPRQIHASMVPGFVAGNYTLDECVAAMEPLVRRAGVRWLQRSVKGLNANQHTLLLDDGSTLQYDWLSINTGSIQNREQIDAAIPGARTHGLFVRPMEAFTTLWPRVAEMGASRALRIAVIGQDAAACELAMCVRHRLANAAVTFITQNSDITPLCIETLKHNKITVLYDSVSAITAEEVKLGCGAGLACDVPLIASPGQPPLWLADSGLELDAKGFIAIDKNLRSTSHTGVFAAGDIISGDHDNAANSGMYGIYAGPTLAHNLAASSTGFALKTYTPPRASRNFINCGNQRAILTWGTFSAYGRWVWWLKNWLDRRFIARYQ